MPSESPQYHAGRGDPYGVDEPNPNPEGATLVGLRPAPERYQAPVFPYRGTEQHGVPPSHCVEPPPHMSEGGQVRIEPKKKDIDPVPVRIVQGGTKEYDQWRAYQTYASANPSPVVNRKENRDSAQVKNIGTIAVWVGPDANLTKMTGFRLDGNGGTVTINGEAEVWAMSDDGSNVPLCVMTQFQTATP